MSQPVSSRRPLDEVVFMRTSLLHSSVQVDSVPIHKIMRTSSVASKGRGTFRRPISSIGRYNHHRGICIANIGFWKGHCPLLISINIYMNHFILFNQMDLFNYIFGCWELKYVKNMIFTFGYHPNLGNYRVSFIGNICICLK